MSTQKTTFIWLFVMVIVLYGIIRIFAHIYESTKQLKAQAQIDRYADINMKIVEPISKAMEEMVKTALPTPELSQSQLLERKKRRDSLSKQFPNAHIFYTHQCASCHGSFGQGGKALSFLGTHLNHSEENIAYYVPPLKQGSWSFHKESPHLPSTGIDKLSTKEFTELKQYLQNLIK